jgi:hypothetical protein
MEYVSTREPYNGPYVKLSNNKFYEGVDSTNLGLEIRPIPRQDLNTFGQSMNCMTYKALKENTYKDLKPFELIPGSKNIPKAEDYIRGYFNRYFLVRINGYHYKEVKKETYDQYEKDKKIDKKLYSLGTINWALVGDVFNINYQTIKLAERIYPNISKLFPIYTEFQQIENYNIPNRLYPNMEEIPPQLPPAYGLPKIAARQCKDCFFFKEGNCKKWQAAVRPNYWCKSWASITKATDNAFAADFNDEELEAFMDSLYLPPMYPRPITPPLQAPIDRDVKHSTNTQSTPSTPSTQQINISRGGSSGGGGGGY